VPELVTSDVTLHVEVDGEGEPVMVLAHGLTNSCRELAMLTGFVPGTKVRFCFRGHGHSSSPLTGYKFVDFARDVRAVADAYDATVAVGTSLGAGAICTLVADDPGRFEKLIFLLPAGLDVEFQHKDMLLETAAMIEGRNPQEAMEAILSDPERVQRYVSAPWLRDLDEQMLADLNTEGVPRAIREVIEDWPLRDRNDMAKVTAPTLFICRRGDVIHPGEIGEILTEIMPNAELIMFEDGDELMAAIPMLIGRVVEFLGT
jgi:pimeloyl-ACP methyl ester carboxylesterase